jgi:arabinose-5-phosphate isomerase
MMMALGDAIATTLLKDRGFSPEDFGKLHPGGTLGQRLVRVGQIMHQGERMPLLPHDTLMQEVLIVMSSKGFGTVGFTNQAGHLIGILTDGDLRRHMSPDLLTKKSFEVMTPDPKVISPTILAEEALALMNKQQITSFFVADEKGDPRKPIGFLHIHDCLRIGLR